MKNMTLQYGTRKLNRDIIHLVEDMRPVTEARQEINALALMGLYETSLIKRPTTGLSKRMNRWMVK